jgi:putative chitinase
MAIDRQTYFDMVRKSLFNGAMSQQQVDGQNAILAQWEDQQTGTPMQDMRWLAYMLATTFHETAKTMWPIEEYGKGAGKPYGVKDKETGQTYYGRGFVQLTWRENYHNATIELSLSGPRDLEYHAEQALDLVIASQIMFRGMAEGWFTAKKLGDYFSETRDDPVNARAIINNDVSKNGSLVAGYHEKFLTAVETAYIDSAPVPEDGRVVVRLEVPEGVPVVFYVNDELVLTAK